MIDHVDSTVRERFDSVEMHEDLTTARTFSDQNSNEGHGTTQSYRQGDELREGEGLQPGSSSSKTAPGTEEFGPSLMRIWASEIAAVVTAFCCLAAICIILAKFNDQQQPNWPYARTLNLSALIALIATILRSMLETVLGSGEYPLLFKVCMCLAREPCSQPPPVELPNMWLQLIRCYFRRRYRSTKMALVPGQVTTPRPCTDV